MRAFERTPRRARNLPDAQAGESERDYNNRVHTGALSI
jgi:hypothetical protein